MLEAGALVRECAELVGQWFGTKNRARPLEMEPIAV
jgi:hypothetical protein